MSSGHILEIMSLQKGTIYIFQTSYPFIARYNYERDLYFPNNPLKLVFKE